MRYVLFTVLLATSGAAQTLGDCTIRTIAGPLATDAGDGGPVAQALLHDPAGMAQDVTGAIYIADRANQKIRKVAPDGTITTFAGTGTIGPTGDAGPASAAGLYWPTGAAIGPDGSLYFAEIPGHRIRRVRPDGTISTVAGTGLPGFGGDGGTASAAILNFPSVVATDPDGNLYIADSQNGRVRRVDVMTGVITTYAGKGPAPNGSGTDLMSDGAPASAVQLGGVLDIATDADGNLFIAAIDYDSEGYTRRYIPSCRWTA